jgi:hypothetical protein
VAVWHGPKTFAPDEPRLFLAPVTPTPSPGPTATPTAVAGTGGASGDDASAALDDGSQGGPSSGSSASGTPLSGLLPVAGATLLVGAGLVGWLSRRERLPLPGMAAGSSSESGGGAAGAVDGTAAGGSVAGTDSPPADLLSPAERVQRSLEHNGGRLRQQELAATRLDRCQDQPRARRPPRGGGRRGVPARPGERGDPPGGGTLR